MTELQDISCWIVCITEDNLNISLAVEAIGFAESKHKRAKAFQVGDLVVFYVSKESLISARRVSRFEGLAVVKGQTYKECEPLWNHGVFPVRVKIQTISTKSCDIRNLIPDLHFIKNKAHWGAALLPGIIKIDQHDFKIIRDHMESG